MLERGRRRHSDRRRGDGVTSDHSDAAVVRRQVVGDARAWSVDYAKAAATQTPETRAVGVVPCFGETSGKSGPKDQVALHYYYTSPSHCCTTHEVSKL